MNDPRTVSQWLVERQMSLAELADRASLDKRIARRIADAQWTPSPQQRERIAAALGVQVDEIRWGHASPVDHMYGHGPQFGRSP